jgi:hypothetical protein
MKLQDVHLFLNLSQMLNWKMSGLLNYAKGKIFGSQERKKKPFAKFYISIAYYILHVRWVWENTQ